MSEQVEKKRGWLGRLIGRHKTEETPAPEERSEDEAVLEREAAPAERTETPAEMAETPAEATVTPAPAASAPPDEKTPAPGAISVMAGEASGENDAAPAAPKPGWLARIRQGLVRSSEKLSTGIVALFTKRKLDDETLEELGDLLISADLGVSAAGRVTERLAKSRFGTDVTPDEVKSALAEEIAVILEPVARPMIVDPARKPHVVLVVGVNGSGKTTTIGKLAKYHRDQGLAVTLVAADTFRAAAVEQLRVWGERAGCPVVFRQQGADAAGVAFDALGEARARRDDLLLIDTAGRLQNKTDLMAELQKISRVLKKQDETAPHDVLLVLDATVGQNAHSQVEIFKDMTEVTGLVVTKLDGTARGGVLVALAERFGLPVHAIGVGERADDLRPFSAQAFARGLVGLD